MGDLFAGPGPPGPPTPPTQGQAYARPFRLDFTVNPSTGASGGGATPLQVAMDGYFEVCGVRFIGASRPKGEIYVTIVRVLGPNPSFGPAEVLGVVWSGYPDRKFGGESWYVPVHRGEYIGVEWWQLADHTGFASVASMEDEPVATAMAFFGKLVPGVPVSGPVIWNETPGSGPGKREILIGTAPANGTQPPAIVIPPGERWHADTMKITLTTDATAGNRNLEFMQKDKNGGEIVTTFDNTPQAPSSGPLSHSAGRGLTTVSPAFSPATIRNTSALGWVEYLVTGAILQIFINSIGAADQTVEHRYNVIRWAMPT